MPRLKSLLPLLPESYSLTLADIGSAGGLKDRWKPVAARVNALMFEPREVSQGDEATAKYLTTLKPTDSLEDLSAQLMGDGKKGIKNVSWSPPKRG